MTEHSSDNNGCSWKKKNVKVFVSSLTKSDRKIKGQSDNDGQPVL